MNHDMRTEASRRNGALEVPDAWMQEVWSVGKSAEGSAVGGEDQVESGGDVGQVSCVEAAAVEVVGQVLEDGGPSAALRRGDRRRHDALDDRHRASA